MKIRAKAVVTAFLFLFSVESNASLIEVDFSADRLWADIGSPFEMKMSPKLKGKMLIDNSFSDERAILDFSLETGNMIWTEDDFVKQYGFKIDYKENGTLKQWDIFGLKNDFGFVNISSLNTIVVYEYAGDLFNYCNECVSFSQRIDGKLVDITVPEPGSFFIMGISILGIEIKRRVRKNFF